MVVLGGAAVSYERGTPVGFRIQGGDAVRGRRTEQNMEEGICKATWKREYKLPWREAGPPNHHDDKMVSDQ